MNVLAEQLHDQENPDSSTLTYRIAGIASWGRHPQNAERDLYRALGLPLVPSMHVYIIM